MLDSINGVSILSALWDLVSTFDSHFLGLTGCFLASVVVLTLATLGSAFAFLMAILLAFGVTVGSLTVFLIFFALGVFP